MAFTINIPIEEILKDLSITLAKLQIISREIAQNDMTPFEYEDRVPPAPPRLTTQVLTMAKALLAQDIAFHATMETMQTFAHISGMSEYQQVQLAAIVRTLYDNQRHSLFVARLPQEPNKRVTICGIQHRVHDT